LKALGIEGLEHTSIEVEFTAVGFPSSLRSPEYGLEMTQKGLLSLEVLALLTVVEN
jgi:hypothetical protein